MSYLVDALRKAERERYAHRVDDLYAASAGTGYTQPASSAGPWLWLVAVLVASNAALAVYVWRPGPDNATEAPTISSAGIPPRSAAPGRPSGGPAAKHPARPRPASSGEAAPFSLLDAQLESRIEPQRPAGNTTRRAVRAVAGKSPRPQTHPIAPPAEARRASTAVPPTDRYNSASADRAGGADSVPPVTINGQLYSTVPGRSFILVDGRRYREGERLAAGPAVQSIDPRGATLLYQGQSYHVSGPG